MKTPPRHNRSDPPPLLAGPETLRRFGEGEEYAAEIHFLDTVCRHHVEDVPERPKEKPAVQEEGAQLRRQVREIAGICGLKIDRRNGSDLAAVLELRLLDERGHMGPHCSANGSDATKHVLFLPDIEIGGSCGAGDRVRGVAGRVIKGVCPAPGAMSL